MWYYWCMLKINWIDRVSNYQILQVNEQITIIDTIKGRKLQWLWHILRHSSPIQVVLLGKKRRGRPKANFILQIPRELGLKYVDIKRKIDDRIHIEDNFFE